MKEYSLEFLHDKSDKMHAYLREAPPSMDNEEDVVKRLMHLGRMLSESGEYKAAASYKVDEIVHGQIGKAIDEALSDKLSVSLISQYVKSAAKEWNYLVNSFDRINSAAGKNMMALQVLISFEKSKMNIH